MPLGAGHSPGGVQAAEQRRWKEACPTWWNDLAALIEIEAERAVEYDMDSVGSTPSNPPS